MYFQLEFEVSIYRIVEIPFYTSIYAHGYNRFGIVKAKSYESNLITARPENPQVSDLFIWLTIKTL